MGKNSGYLSDSMVGWVGDTLDCRLGTVGIFGLKGITSGCLSVWPCVLGIC